MIRLILSTNVTKNIQVCYCEETLNICSKHLMDINDSIEKLELESLSNRYL